MILYCDPCITNEEEKRPSKCIVSLRKNCVSIYISIVSYPSCYPVVMSQGDKAVKYSILYRRNKVLERLTDVSVKDTVNILVTSLQ